MIDRLLTIGKTAEMLGISKWQVHDYVRDGYLRAVKLPSGRKRIALSEIQGYIKTLKREVTAKRSELVKANDVDWSLDFVAKHNRFPSSEELAKRKVGGKSNREQLQATPRNYSES